jgi:hypothetical protein
VILQRGLVTDPTWRCFATAPSFENCSMNYMQGGSVTSLNWVPRFLPLHLNCPRLKPISRSAPSSLLAVAPRAAIPVRSSLRVPSQFVPGVANRLNLLSFTVLGSLIVLICFFGSDSARWPRTTRGGKCRSYVAFPVRSCETIGNGLSQRRMTPSTSPSPYAVQARRAGST